MTKDDIIRMALECDLGRVCGPLDTLLDYEWEILQHFANLVAAAEREACAQIVDDFGDEWMCDSHMLSKQIRARGNT
jgi:hypothetical protein